MLWDWAFFFVMGIVMVSAKEHNSTVKEVISNLSKTVPCALQTFPRARQPVPPHSARIEPGTRLPTINGVELARWNQQYQQSRQKNSRRVK
jgi:hypothetical protein